MAQYTEFPGDETYIEITGDPGVVYRLVISVAAGTLYLRQAVSATGFAGVETTDWMTIEKYILPSFPGISYRVGVRDAHWVIDQTYAPDFLGFAGDEGADWDNIEKHQL